MINNEIIKTARQIIGQFIRQARKQKDLTQEELAAAVGVTMATISKIEAGRFNYSIDILSKISIVLDFKIQFETKDEPTDEKRFCFNRNYSKGEILDQKTGIAVYFDLGSFNETQVIAKLPGQPLRVAEIATAMREMGDWLAVNHPEVI